MNKPKVTKEVAEWFEENKGDLDYNIWKLCTDWEETEDIPIKVFINETPNALKTLFEMENGYTVVDEQRYYVIFAENLSCWKYWYLGGDEDYYIMCKTDNIKDMQSYTEEELRKENPTYWLLARPVEEFNIS